MNEEQVLGELDSLLKIHDVCDNNISLWCLSRSFYYLGQEIYLQFLSLVQGFFQITHSKDKRHRGMKGKTISQQFVSDKK